MLSDSHRSYLGKFHAFPNNLTVELILVNKGNGYHYETLDESNSIDSLIARLAPETWYFKELVKIRNTIEPQKKVRRLIKLGIAEKINGVVHKVYSKCPAVSSHNYRKQWKYRGSKQGYVLKRESRKKEYKKRMKDRLYQRRYTNPGKELNEFLYHPEKFVDPFEGISSNVFGHPRRKLMLADKKEQPGYRRPKAVEEERKIIND